MPPVKISSWDGVKLALNYGSMSPQSIKPEDDMFPVHYYWPLWEGRNYPQDNSCQNLNIWTSGLDDAKRPAMIWLHGGGFQAGSSLAEDVFRGENLARKGDVVVVSLNHRLNVLGFLDLSAYGEKYKYSGNLGMMDIVAALEWVRDNISHFGGDPSNVTLFGQSGGGAKILTLMAMPSAKGLFHKVIEQSGAVQMMGITLPDQKISRRVAELVLADLGIDPANVDSLKDVPFERLDMAGKKALAEVKISWAPVKDGEIIPKDPVKGGFSDWVKDIPLMAGSVLNEWISVPLVVNMAENQSDNKNFWDEAKTSAKLRERFGDKAQALADKMSQAWIDFARTGNPGWEAYTPENGMTMIFDDVPVLGNHHDAELLKLLTE